MIFLRWVTGTSPCDPNLSQPSGNYGSVHLTRSVRRRAASFKRGSRKLAQWLAKRLRFLCRRGRRRRDGDVGPQRFEALRADPANCEQILNAAESATLLAGIEDPLRRDWPHTRQFLQLLNRRGIKVDRFCGRLFLRFQNPTQQNEHQPCRENFNRKVSRSSHHAFRGRKRMVSPKVHRLGDGDIPLNANFWSPRVV